MTSTARRYGSAVVVVVGALLIWHATMRGLRLGPFQILLAAVFLAAVYGGAGPGILAGVLCIGGSVFLYMRPEQRDVVQMAIFIVFSIAILLVAGERSRLRARERLAQAAAEEEQRHAVRLMAERDAMASLIQDLLNGSRLELNDQPGLEIAPVDLVRLVRQVVSDQQRGEVQRIIFRTTVPKITGKWDGLRLERAVTSLVSNAVKYSPGGQDVTVTVSCHQDEWTFARVRAEVHGMGIPADDLLRVFQRYYRGGKVVGSIPGTGIGLTSAKQIVEAHGGAITVESIEGSGTAFVISLPLTADVGAAVSGNSRHNRPSS